MSVPRETAAAAAAGQRLDKWLWFARIAKTRTLAAGLVTGGKIRVNRLRVDKPSHCVRSGDVVTASLGPVVRVLQVRTPGARRGPAAEAQTLYEELTPVAEQTKRHQTAKPLSGNEVSLAGYIGRVRGAGRPTKRERRQIDRVKGDLS